MTDDLAPALGPATTAPPASTTLSQAETADYVQLTQQRVPLDEAGEAFAVPDASGRLPIVILPQQPFRIRNEFVLGGVIAIVLGILLDIDVGPRTGIVALGVVAVFLGVFQSFVVNVPEGARAILLRRGQLWKSIGPGRHVVPPWIVVSHVVTTREIPFDSPSSEVPTQDGVRVNVDILLTFLISEPERFVYAISAPDFDQVCQAACLDAVRTLIRGVPADHVLDLSGRDSAILLGRIGETLGEYGVTAHRVVITHIRPPIEFVRSLESRRLAAFQRAEQDEHQALEERRLADRQALERQRLEAERTHLEIEAANEEYRLKRLGERIRAHPEAARYDVDSARLDVARALAGNTRAMLSVGPGSDVASSLVMRDALADASPPGDDGTPPGTDRGSGKAPAGRRGRPQGSST
jgi:regulator of protease activity HflC (stomatin/prohibitin superfamily)